MIPNEYTVGALQQYRYAVDRILDSAEHGWIEEETACHFIDRLTDAFKAAGTVPEEAEFEAAEDGKPAGFSEI